MIDPPTEEMEEVVDLELPPTKQVADPKWIDQLPSHWETRRAKYLFEEMDRSVREQDEVITAFRDGEVTLRSNRREEGYTFATKEVGYQGIRRGDLVIHAMDAFAGAIGVSDSDGKGSPVYAVCRPVEDIEVRYYAYLLRDLARTGFIEALSRGIRQRSTDFRFNIFADVSLPVFERSEQRAIANFLDRETSRIDKLIDRKKRLIELLEEKRTALITRAVTRGLDPDVPMKDSGVEWLGEIPEHWEVSYFSWVVDVKEGPGILAKDFRDEGVPLLRISNLSGKGVDVEGCDFLEPGMVARKWDHFRVEVGDLLISGSATSGEVSEVGEEAAGAIPYTGLMRLRPDESQLCRDFLRFFLRSPVFLEQVNVLRTGVGIQHFGPTHLRKVALPMPPLPEQEELVASLDPVDQAIARTVRVTQHAMSLLDEYRTALISAAVTGKIDVRDKAA